MKYGLELIKHKILEVNAIYKHQLETTKGRFSSHEFLNDEEKPGVIFFSDLGDLTVLYDSCIDKSESEEELWEYGSDGSMITKAKKAKIKYDPLEGDVLKLAPGHQEAPDLTSDFHGERSLCMRGDAAGASQVVFHARGVGLEPS